MGKSPDDMLMLGYGLGKIDAEFEARERARRRSIRGLKIESVQLKDDKVYVRIRNMGSRSYFYFSIDLYEVLDKPVEKSHLFGFIREVKDKELLAGLITDLEIPINDFEDIELKPKNKLLKGRKYKIIISVDDVSLAYNFTVDEKGNIVPL